MKKKYIAIIALGIFLIWAGSAAAIYRWVGDEDRGTFGDMFGAVNALFSGFAFAGLIYTIAVQRQELTLQREAIQMQTEELKLQREETARSADQLEGQKNLLNLQMALGIVNDLIITKNKMREESYKVRGYNRAHTFADMLRDYQHDRELITEEAIHLQSYLDTFFFILKFIQDYDLQKEHKAMLNDLVNTNTSDTEVVLIYIAVEKSQHRLTMLKIHGFYPRHLKLTSQTVNPS